MQNKYSIFVPWSCSFDSREKFIKFNHSYKQKQYYFKANKKPFFGLVNEDTTPKGFIDAIMNDNKEDAQGYLSKNLGVGVDLDTVKAIFKDDYSYKYLIDVNFKNNSWQKVKSVMIKDKNSKFKCIVHFYLVKEPDSFSNWKIFKIVKE